MLTSLGTFMDKKLLARGGYRMAERKMLKEIIPGKKFNKLKFQQEMATYNCTENQMVGLKVGGLYDVEFGFEPARNPKTGETWQQRVIVTIQAFENGAVKAPAPFPGRFSDKKTEEEFVEQGAMSRMTGAPGRPAPESKSMDTREQSISFCNALNNSVQMTMAYANAMASCGKFHDLTIEAVDATLTQFQADQFERFKKEHGV